MKKYKRFAWLLALSVLAAAPVMAQSTTPDTTANNEGTRANRLGFESIR